MEEQKIDKIENKKKFNKTCFRCFILDVILVSLVTFLSVLFDEFYLGTLICFFLALIFFFIPIISAIKLRVFSFNFLANLLLTVFIIFWAIMASTATCCGAKEAASAARIKADMDQFKSSAENYKTINGSYGALINMKINNKEGCKEMPNSLMSKEIYGKDLCEDIQSQKGGGELVIYSNATAYCIQKTLPGKPESIWCVDSDGNVGSTYIECNLNNFSCEK